MSPPTPLTFTFKTIPKPSSPSSPLEIKLDVHLPPIADLSPPLPILFCFHPGGFISYGRDHIPPWVFDLARDAGWIVISPDYRLLIGSLEGKEKGDLDAGDCIDDVLEAYEWVVGGELEKALEKDGKKMKVDTTRISAVGFSIGGLLTQLLPSLLPSHLPPLSSVISLYGVSRLTHPFYSTPRSAHGTGELKSLGLSSEFNKISSDLFTRLWTSETIAGELDYTPEQKRELEKVGAQGYRGMLWDWAVEHGFVLPLLLGKGIPPFQNQGKNDPLPSSTPSQLTSLTTHLQTLTARIQPYVGPNSILPTTSHPHPQTFLIHGDKDTLVPFSDSIWSLGKLVEGGVRAKYVSVPGVDHGFDGAVRLVDGWRYDGLWREVREWVEEGWEGGNKKA